MSTQNVGLPLAFSHLESLSRGHFIGGEFVNFDDDGTATVLNPSTGSPLIELPVGQMTAVNAAVASARAAQALWRKTTPANRADLLSSIAAVVDGNAELLAQVESLNVGKPISVSREEIAGAADALRFMAGAVRSQTSVAPAEYASGNLSMVLREPVGVVAAITPWNYPLMMAIWKIAPSLAMGNAIVVKPSDLTPISTLLFAELVREVVPAGLINVVLGAGRVVGQALAEHDDVDLITVTGSVETGRAVARAAAATLKRAHLELGGKAPVVIFEDADISGAAETVAMMGYYNTGQECGAATRVLVHESVADEFTRALSERAVAITTGPPSENEEFDLGPLVSEAQRNRVRDAVERAVAEGARVAVGGSTPEGDGYYFPATVVVEVKPGMDIAKTEIFGPVISIEVFSDEDEAIQRANDVEYGLAASVWTRNGALSLRVSDALDFGTVWVNSHLTLASEMPWGGFSKSGYGREMSLLALDDYSRTKHVMLSKKG